MCTSVKEKGIRFDVKIFSESEGEILQLLSWGHIACIVCVGGGGGA